MAAASDFMSLPVGFRFRPTEEELINHYLKNKIQDKDFNNVIPEIDLCKCEPWDLPGFSLIVSDDDEWYYFSRPQYSKSNKRIRTTKEGFWKITSRNRKIKARDSRAVNPVIGNKRTLTFYIGKVRSGQKTNWVIHEYYIADQRDFELIRLKKKHESTDIASCDEGGPRTDNALVHQEDFSEETSRAEENFASLSPTPGSPSSNDVLSSIKDFAKETTPPEEIISSLFATPKPPSHSYVLQGGMEMQRHSATEAQMMRTETSQSADASPTRRLKPMQVKYTTTQVTHQSKTFWNNHSAQSVTGRIRPVELQTGKSAGGSLIVCKTSPLSLKSYLPIICIVIGICSYFFLGKLFGIGARLTMK